MIPTDELEWAQQLFGASDLGDARRSARLVNVASRMAKHMGSSLTKSCESDQAALLGSYRLMRNGAVTPEAIRASGFAGTAKTAQEAQCLLAIEDTTCARYEHAVAAQLGLTGGKQSRNGFMVHSVLLLDAGSGHTLGLIEQQHWQRDPTSYGKNHIPTGHRPVSNGRLPGPGKLQVAASLHRSGQAAWPCDAAHPVSVRPRIGHL